MACFPSPILTEACYRLVTAERKVMLLLYTLHKRGFEQLRLSAGISPSGLHWRCEIAPATSPGWGNRQERAYARGTAYSGNGKSPPFSWDDAEAASPEELAALFTERFPAVVEAGRGVDAAYAAWCKNVLELTEPEGLPVMYGEYHNLSNGIYASGM